MRITRWVSFTWDLAQIELPEVTTPPHYQLDVGREDGAELERMIGKALALDPSWNSTMHEAGALVRNSIARALALETTVCLALRHGRRIIGGSLLSFGANASEHLIPGPCVLVEYRNRGWGTLLLASALCYLRDAGVTAAHAIAREGSLAARFLYPKFGSSPSPIAPLLAA